MSSLSLERVRPQIVRLIPATENDVKFLAESDERGRLEAWGYGFKPGEQKLKEEAYERRLYDRNCEMLIAWISGDNRRVGSIFIQHKYKEPKPVKIFERIYRDSEERNKFIPPTTLKLPQSLLSNKHVDISYIMHVSVLEPFQGLGIGTWMIRDTMRRALERRSEVFAYETRFGGPITRATPEIPIYDGEISGSGYGGRHVLGIRRLDYVCPWKPKTLMSQGAF